MALGPKRPDSKTSALPSDNTSPNLDLAFSQGLVTLGNEGQLPVV